MTEPPHRFVASPTPLSGKRILVVEDMALVAQEIAFILKRIGCDVVGPVAVLEEAQQIIQDNPPDGVVLDVNLNGIESYPLADELQARGIPFVFTTGYGMQSMPAKYQKQSRLEKPFGLEDLKSKVNEMLSVGTS